MKMCILVTFCNGLGNWILFSSALIALKRLYPDSTLDIVFDSEWRDSRSNAVIDICKAWPLIDNIKWYPCDIDGYDLYFTTRWNFGRVHELFLKLTSIPQREPRWRFGQHEVQYYLGHLHQLGYRGEIPMPFVPLADGPILPVQNSARSFNVCMSNGALNLPAWQKKKWPYFPELAQALEREYGARIVWVGGKDEFDEGERVKEKAGSIVNYAGKLSIMETARVIYQCQLGIMNDSGLMHVADGLGIPLVAIFGPTYTSKNRPYFTKSRIVKSHLPCVPCQESQSFFVCEDNMCMKDISVEQVMEGVEGLIK